MTALTSSKRLVVKIGSSILVDETNGLIRRDWLDALTDDVARLHNQGCEIVYLHIFDIDDLDHLRLIGAEVVPQVA